jgi:hypothetical protein
MFKYFKLFDNLDLRDGKRAYLIFPKYIEIEVCIYIFNIFSILIENKLWSLNSRKIRLMRLLNIMWSLDLQILFWKNFL